MKKKEQYLFSAIAFSTLMLFKHIFIYIAPAVFLWFFINFCANQRLSFAKNLINFLKLGIFVTLITIIGVLPFIIDISPSKGIHIDTQSAIAQLKQMKSRLFPFKRGLTHAYWAPNFWALYNFFDKIFGTLYIKKHQIVRKLPHATHDLFLKICEFMEKWVDKSKLIDNQRVGSFTGGLVGENQGGYIFLPNISPNLVNTLTFGLSFFLCAIRLMFRRTSKDSKKTPTKEIRRFWNIFNLETDNSNPDLKPNVESLLECSVLSSFVFFMFGWHVHEKAILNVLVPIQLLFGYYFCKLCFCNQNTSESAIFKKKFASLFNTWYYLSIAAIFSLFPLLFDLKELFVKWSLLICFVVGVEFFKGVVTQTTKETKIGASFLQKLLIFSLFCLEIWKEVIDPLLGITQTRFQLPFLNLMITSVLCAFCVVHSFCLIILF